MKQNKEKFATQVDEKILSTIKEIANDEGRQIQAIVNEALCDLIDKRKNLKARSHVMEAYMKSHKSYKSLYTELAK
jgi:hypothetical protein